LRGGGSRIGGEGEERDRPLRRAVRFEEKSPPSAERGKRKEKAGFQGKEKKIRTGR